MTEPKHARDCTQFDCEHIDKLLKAPRGLKGHCPIPSCDNYVLSCPVHWQLKVK